MKINLDPLLFAATGLRRSHVQSQRCIKQLFKDIKKEGYSFAITAPAWLVKAGINAAADHNSLEKDKDIWLSLKIKSKESGFSLTIKVMTSNKIS